jgi:GrpB-like predicted nucleotidyltransferase (UPF0157 family)
MNIILVAHDPEWRLKFEAEANVVRAVFGPAATAIHHIGSTAIPGILAKPIIDMLVEAATIEVVDERTAFIEALGYEAKGEFGIPGRRYFRKDNASGTREYQMHAFAAASGEIRRHLAFRDYLRSYPNVAREYSRLKLELSKRYPSDIQAYTDAKAPFIRAVERQALAQ